MLSVSKDFVLKIVKTSALVFISFFLSFFLSSLNPLVKPVEATSETRYFRGDTQTVNGLSAYQLGTAQSNTRRTTFYQLTGDGGSSLVTWGIRVWKRTSGGVETEITSGSPVATVERSGNGAGTQLGYWSPPPTILNTTDSIVIRVYIQVGTSGWQQGGTPPVFTTNQLGNTLLGQEEWTVIYYTTRTSRTTGGQAGRYTQGDFDWGTSTYNSRIENFTHYTPTTTVGTSGTQNSQTYPNTNDFNIGGSFTFVRNEGSGNVTSITISHTGSVSSSNLSDLKLYYKQESSCSTSKPVDATLFNSTPGSFSSGSSTVTGSMSVGATQTCLYVQLDIGSGAQIGETIEIQITNPSTQVTVASGVVTPATAVVITGTTTIAEAPIVSISIETDGDIDYGILPATESRSTIDLSDTQTIKNTGNVNIDLQIKSTNAFGGVPWELSSTYGNDTFVHEYSTDSGSLWNKFFISDQYFSLISGLTPTSTQNVDFRITVPSLTTDYLEKNITITILATESI
ncbi:hypothetical protein CVU76_01740 [Candidatus Dojkabacteria bacterium HGW-Dojkabacteria-1]|uniref:Uncharacterized protein n=1 Tax=Candidatus Dojkabacteria bacterium HGW-Dojkabacteria-1 TaxID=2013761 RepID=A0A2N2F3I7_9BACT|nr:MAG: hypothetical protein CVU76_01740 [Candidatus Dojkabacteria bacterium HGW-Dojkabacteria-1]